MKRTKCEGCLWADNCDSNTYEDCELFSAEFDDHAEIEYVSDLQMRQEAYGEQLKEQDA